LKNGHKCDFVIALTHQWVAEDRQTLLDNGDINLLIGGHDHTAYIERANDDGKDTTK
jgi:2',3'-cyclic-nucleotide 2'-phosphodiesterase (5'-nucleotidase family)